MKNTTFIAALACLLLSGCTTTTHGVSVASCKVISIPANCVPNGSPPEVNVNTNALTFAPPNLCAKAGETVTFKLTPPPNNEKGNAAITAKNPSHTWLNGTNFADKHEIVINVPDWVTPGHYNYGLYLSDGRCVDPRVQVKR